MGGSRRCYRAGFKGKERDHESRSAGGPLEASKGKAADSHLKPEKACRLTDGFRTCSIIFILFL